MLKKINFYEYIAEKITRYFDNKNNLNTEDFERLYLGVMVVLINTIKFLIVFITAFFMGIFKETIILLAMFTLIRLSAAGIHLKSSFWCTVACLISYLGSAIIAVRYPIDINKAFFISAVFILILFKYSPADTENRPILGKEHRKKLKFRTFISSIVLLLINVFLKDEVIFNLMMYAFFIEIVCVSPVTYRLLKVKYNNYMDIE